MFMVMERSEGNDYSEPVSLHRTRMGAIEFIRGEVEESRRTTMIHPFDPDNCLTWSRDAWDGFTIQEFEIKD
jgi:hypothetical protein